ncbi:hypothetical protein ACM64Y_17335 [Novispirillum sp. DQ9]|uniref:hypothetical protein n=1 Tax=Novispirillum sp. DQ9 TaxID=3398612 RepID=UPI003C79749A
MDLYEFGVAPYFEIWLFRIMPRLSADDKLSEQDLDMLQVMVERGVQIFGTADKFAAAAKVRPAVVSMARHRRLVGKTQQTVRILNFEFDEAVRLDCPQKPDVSTDLDSEIAEAVERLSRRSKGQKKDVLKLLRAMASLAR